ncbi:MAG: tetratricopeptide repeat protein [Nitrospirae bacterium]|nr:tetratricopeptide repeat protein [Nitrospirota bacterium]
MSRNKLPNTLSHPYIAFILFASIGTLIYLNSLNNPFQFDDFNVVVNNFKIQEIKNIPYFFINPRFGANNPMAAGHYRPILFTSYAINYAIGGLNTLGYHIVNLAFHIGTAFLVFLIVKGMLEDSKQVAVSSEQIAENKQKLEARSQTTADIQRDKNVPPIDSRGFLTPTFVDSRGFLTPMFVASVASGLIFLVHPFNSEAVNYITARSSIMSGFFYLLGFYCWVLFRSQKKEARSKKLEARSKISEERSQKQEVRSQQAEERSKKAEVRSKIGEDRQGFSNFLPLTSYFYLFSLLAFIAGMLSKEVVITLPVMLWLYDLYGFSRSKKLEARSKNQEDNTVINKYAVFDLRTYIPYLPFVLLVAIPYLLVRLFSLGRVLDKFQRGFITQLFTELPVLVRHWQMFFIPKGFSLVHDVDVFHGMTWLFMVSVVILILYLCGIVYLFLYGKGRWRIISFFMLWFFIVLLPTTIIPLNAIFQENRGYMALLSFAVPAGIAIETLFNYKKSVVLKVIVLLLLLAVYGSITMQRNIVWGDDIKLWKDALEKSPQSGISFAGLSLAYKNSGDTFLSIETAKKGISVEPDSYYLHMLIGADFQALGQMDEAAKEYENALNIDAGFGNVWNDLAVLYIEKNNLERAEQCLKNGIKVWKDLPPLYYNLGRIDIMRGDFVNAISHYETAVKLYPDYLTVRYDMGEAYEKLNKIDQAKEQYREIIKYKTINLKNLNYRYGLDEKIAGEIIAKAEQKFNQ